MATHKNDFVVEVSIKGKSSGKGLEGLSVEALDKDLFQDDRVGTAVTDAEGKARIVYDKKNFGDDFWKTRPDLYLQIRNKQGDVIYTTRDSVRTKAAKSEKFVLELSEDLLEDVPVENKRTQFKDLIAINPDYFNQISTVFAEGPNNDQDGSTRYEELECLGYYPEKQELEAIFKVKLPYGFSGPLCEDGSTEYVAFYVDFNDDGTFVSIGAPAELNTHDLHYVSEDHLCYAVTKEFNPERWSCNKPQILKVRAILSWEQAPTGPNFKPVWGNVIECYVQILPQPFFPFFPDIPTLSSGFVLPDDLTKLKTAAEIIDTSIAAKTKNPDKVETHRFNFPLHLAKNPNYYGGISDSSDIEAVKNAMLQLPSAMLEDLDLSNFEQYLPEENLNDGNTSYEELTCVGLYPELDLLEATFRIKRPTGYSGGLCTSGSTEYIGFYIDWGTGVFEFEGMAKVAAHDISGTEKKPICYAGSLRIKNIKERLKSCKRENVVRVRATLSWEQVPNPSDPDFKIIWGNRMDCAIQLRPLPLKNRSCELQTINEIHVDDIDAVGYAVKLSGGSFIPGTYDRPFGGIVAAKGNVFNISGASYYRFQYSDDGGVNWVNITDPRITKDGGTPHKKSVAPDAMGWFGIAAYHSDWLNYSPSPLCNWRSYGKNGTYLLRLEIGDAFKNQMVGMPAPAGWRWTIPMLICINLSGLRCPTQAFR